MIKTLFRTERKTMPANTINEAGGIAYALSDKEALAQMVMTGTLGGTYYSSPEKELDTVLELAKKCPPDFVAKAAIYARQNGKMKDTPVLLLAHLSTRGDEGVALVKKIFNRVVSNTKALRNFFQIIRSGRLGRKNFGTALRNCISNWLASKSEDQLFDGSIGNNPTLGDVIKLSHIKPNSVTRENFHNYLLGRKYNLMLLPERIRQYEMFKKGEYSETPNIPFDFLTALSLSEAQWTEIARNAPWNMTRMNLNTFARHGVFKSPEMVKLIADRLRNPELVKKFNVFPYQIMTSLNNVKDCPMEIKNALQEALDLSIDNVPEYQGNVCVCLDVSGSMTSAVTGNRGSVTSSVSCLDVAALFASAILRKNKNAHVIPFSDDVVHQGLNILNPRDSVWTNSKKLRSLPSGGTNCSSALRYINESKLNPDLVIYVSDNQSWVDNASRWNSGTATMEQFNKLKKTSKMVCVDLQPNTTTQAPNSNRILNVSGFGDQVWNVIESWYDKKYNFVETIEKVDIS